MLAIFPLESLNQNPKEKYQQDISKYDPFTPQDMLTMINLLS
jgi:hypothetical protein